MTIYATGVDYSNPQTPARVLVEHGAQFACRYASTPGNPKNLTLNEANLLREAGIGIVSLFETTAQRALAGEVAGADDLVSARTQHKALGLPDDAPVYLTVDFDLATSQESELANYFHGVDSVAGNHPVGVYGGYRACQFLLTEGLVEFAFQTYAWSNGTWVASAHLRQVHNGASWDGWPVDICEAHVADYGAWGLQPAPGPTPGPTPMDWTDVMITNLPNVSQGAVDPVSGSMLVHRAQAILRDVAGHAEVAVDGSFGPITEAAVRAYQRGFALTVDGVVGPHTWARLLADRVL
jgi:peptidoglycan hydrolase-like protein with peptidoglycan-binding domain